MSYRLEDYFTIQQHPAPIVIVDWMVLSHVAYDTLKPLKDHVSEKRWRLLAKACWVNILNRGPEFLPQSPWRTIIVNDYKDETGGYWRKAVGAACPGLQQAWDDYAERTGKSPERRYKGNRSARPDDFWIVEEEGREYASKYFPMFSEKGFEADDWAGLAYRLHRGNRQMFLHTVDRDWSMLVDDDRGIFFANTRRPRANEAVKQRLIDNEAVCYHTETKVGVKINHPRELAFAKSEKGDMGDNLPPGSPVYLFDLCEPPEEWKLENYSPEKTSLFLKELENPESNIRLDHLEKVEATFPEFIEGVRFNQSPEFF